MKKAAIIFLTFIYLFVTSGIVFHFHYCEGKIVGISLVDEKDLDDCCDENIIIQKNCCEEKKSVFKIKDTQHSSTKLKTPTISVKTINPYFSEINTHLNKNFELKNISTAHHAPDIYQNPIYLQHRILIL